MLPELMLRVLPEYETARVAFNELIGKSRRRLVRFEQLRQRGVEYRERIEKARHIEEYGASALFACRDEGRALKKIDRLVFNSQSRSTATFRDRISGAKFSVPLGEVVPAIRRLAYLGTVDVTARSDFCVSKPGPALEKAMKSFYGEKEAARKLKLLRTKGRWEKIVQENSSRLVCAARLDFSAPGTTLVSCWASVPMFLASPNYMADGFANAREEKFFCLWMNSTLGIFQLLPAASSTRGSWVRLERFTVDRMLLPDPSSLSAEDWAKVDRLWGAVGTLPLRSLAEQFQDGDSFRQQLDDGLLELVGIATPAERAHFGGSLRSGTLAAIQALRRAMGSSPMEADTEADRA